MAYPPPLFHWQHIVPHDDEVAGNFQQLENGSLLLTGVKAPAIYKCMAWNEYGTSIQFIYISKCKPLTNVKYSSVCYSYFVRLIIQKTGL